jgi:hypothetical protein
MAEGGSMEVDEMQEDVPVELPLDVIAAACVHLAARDVVNVMCASRGWYGVASRDELWVHLCATEWGDNWAAPPAAPVLTGFSSWNAVFSVPPFRNPCP